MNTFNIPSWYPSYENPIYGTFVKEQIEILSRENPDWNFGVSTWGQGRPSHMLPMKDHVLNIGKVIQKRKFQVYSDHQTNITHFYQPALTWTRKVLHGNLAGLVKANDKNLLSFKKQVENLDIIHAQATYPAALIAQALSEKYGIPYVVSIRMSPFPFEEFLNMEGKIKSLIQAPLQKANALIATSHSLKEQMENFGLSNIEVIHNPVDHDFFKPSGEEADELTLLTIGRLEHQKGIDVLIEAMVLLEGKFSGKLRIGGEGSLKKVYQKSALENGVNDKIEWLGELSREQVRNEMRRCSFYVLPSRHETFGNVLLEAMAIGKPVVATKCGGPEEIVAREAGLLCEKENAEDLAKQILRMNQDYKAFRADDLRKYVQAKFSPETFSNQMKKIYSSAIAS